MTFIVRVNMIRGIFSLWRSPGSRTLASADKQETCPAHSLFLRAPNTPEESTPEINTPDNSTLEVDLPLQCRGCSFPRDSFGVSLLECLALILLIILSPKLPWAHQMSMSPVLPTPVLQWTAALLA